MLVYGRNGVSIVFSKRELYKKIRKIYIQDNLYSKFEKDIPLELKSLVNLVEKRKIDSLAQGVHQGIMLDMEDYQFKTINDLLKMEAKFILILDHLEDPHNLGAIIRTAVASGVDAIIIPRNREVSVTKSVFKTSAGTLFDMMLVEVTNINKTIKDLKENGFWIVGTSMDGDDYRSIDYSGKIALVIGNEGKGIKRLTKENCDFLVSIPISSKVESLNASVAAGIMMYEVVRNRK